MLISCDDTNPAKPEIYVTNDTLNDEHFGIVCRLRNNKAEIIKEFRKEISSPAMSAVKALEIDLGEDLVTKEDKRRKYIEYTLYKNDKIVLNGTTLFVRPKEFEFLPADISYKIIENECGFELELSSDVYAKSVCLNLSEHDCVFSDNWFDIHGGESVKVTVPKENKAFDNTVLTEEMLKKELCIRSY